MTAVRHGVELASVGTRESKEVSADGNQEVCVVAQRA
jgi:hypothetical protein